MNDTNGAAMAASGRTCVECGRGDLPHKSGGRCGNCYQNAKRRSRATKLPEKAQTDQTVQAQTSTSGPGHTGDCPCLGCAFERERLHPVMLRDAV